MLLTQVTEECIILRSLWVITFVSKLHQGSISDKAIVQQSGSLNHLTAENLFQQTKEL